MKETLKLALEALEYYTEQTRPIHQTSEAITAIKEALAQPAQEPVATFDEVWDSIDWDKWRMEPIRKLVKMIHSKTTPPQRPWVGLTDAEAQWLYDNCRTPSNLIDMVETMLKDKNI